jgi:DNA-binding MarR family transcriptional regulator
MEITDPIVEQFIELIQRFIRLRLNWLRPEHLVRFHQQMEDSRGGSVGNLEEYTSLFRVFTILAQNETSPTMGELSNEIGVPLSSATRMVDWLVRANFVERINDLNDRRVVRVHMTDTGWRFYETGMEYNKKQIAYLLKNFTPDEQTELLRLMNKLFAALLAEHAGLQSASQTDPD